MLRLYSDTCSPNTPHKVKEASGCLWGVSFLSPTYNFFVDMATYLVGAFSTGSLITAKSVGGHIEL